MSTAIKEWPILFSGEMVRAILAGRKSMTRRVVKPRHHFEVDDPGDGSGRLWPYYPCYVTGDPEPVEIPCQYGEVGDRLWVRETFRHYANTSTRNDEWRACVQYKADDARLEIGCWSNFDEAPTQKWWNTGKQPWTPPIHMPRWASRLTLEVTDVRVERLQQITDQDCEREGVVDHYACEEPNLESHDPDDCGVHRCNPIADFRRTWDALNGPRGYGWASNPWVWIVSFKRLEQ